MKNGIAVYALPLAAAFLLAACGSAPKQMYYWKGYNDAVYERLKNDDSTVGGQISKMEKYFNEAERKQLPAAPGAHAHMGLLLIDAGRTDAAKSQFEAEKQLFPESGKFMDFLLKNKAKGAKK
ncbi:DUF4810 domain-containing protein [Neisseria animalis]|uniref:DUF4810 domain-containing protein n=1 Tax=Neisseria animalis TaxID=492 RepID=A0A5P3MTP3_NEIAN|nr:DUF4810 domain-containing protein [Neisseria animalis]QEY24850.1 DUF4810 domain-containing protein [Neisseria animalis]ROW31551.1 DUF4810 domain-containing protein [Neisseria animalis]VEE07999.1 putative lipoprotein [Neisseria animalis]